MQSLTRRRFVSSLGAAAAGAAFGTAAHAAPEAPLRICLLSGSKEYDSEPSLIRLQKELEATENIRCSRAFGQDKGTGLPGLEALASSDLMVVFTRRVVLPEAQLGVVKAYCGAGKPV